MPSFDQMIYKAKPKAARIPTTRAPVLAMFKPDAPLASAVEEADASAVEEAESPPKVELAVSEAPEPEAERVDDEVAEALSEELELEEVRSSRVLLPQLVEWQAVWASKSLGLAATH